MPKKENIMPTNENFHITRNPISLQELVSKVEQPGAGAILLFAGTVREWTHGKRTLALSYEGYEPMALKELQRIGDGISAQWPGVEIAITHRLGDLDIGDVSVAIAVSSPHRPQAYAASRYAIEELKRTVPIWKKEIYEDGVEWVEGCHIHETAWMETESAGEHLHTHWSNRDRYARQIRFGPIPNSSPVPLDEAQRLVLSTVRPLPIIQIPLSKAYGCYLAQEVKADHDIPSFDHSSVDGYALRAEDVKFASRLNPVKLHTIEEIPAGHIPQQEIIRDTASRIMTGAPVPKGANAVVKVEETKLDEEAGQGVLIYQPVSVGESIARQAGDIENGKILLTQGTFLGAIEVGLLAIFGVSVVSVYAKPKVGILSTGTELLDADQSILPGKHRDSNGVMLAGLVSQVGGDSDFWGIVKDHPEELEKRMIEALQQSDILVTSGGVSMGDYDFLGMAFEKIGAKIVFWKTLIRPGMPVLFGTWQDKPIFALAGNPASAYINAWLFLLPAIRSMCGSKDPLPKRISVINDEAIEGKEMPHTRFLRGLTYISESGELRVKISRKQSSNVLSSFLESNCLVRVPGGKGYSSGELVEVELLRNVDERVDDSTSSGGR